MQTVPKIPLNSSTAYTKYLKAYWPCSEGSGNYALDYSGNQNDASPYYCPVWRPNFTISSAFNLFCMRPTSNASALARTFVYEVTAGSGTTTTEPSWPETNGGTVVKDGITWAARAVDPVWSGGGIECGSVGAYFHPRNARAIFDDAMGYSPVGGSGAWRYTATTLSCSTATVSIDDSAGLIPSGLASGDILAVFGLSSLDNQNYVVVSGTPTTTRITLAAPGPNATDTNASARPITLVKVNRPHSVVVSAKVTMLATNGATRCSVIRPANYYNPSGVASGGYEIGCLRESATACLTSLFSAGGTSVSGGNSGNLTVNVESHLLWYIDFPAASLGLYRNGTQEATLSLTGAANRMPVMRDYVDDNWFNRCILQAPMFNGTAGKCRVRDVQIYVAPTLTPGLSSNGNFKDLVTKLQNGFGPITAAEWGQ